MTATTNNSDRALIDELLRHRLEMLSKEIPELKAAFDGNNLILNVCVAYSRQVTRENVVLKERLDAAEAKIDEHETELAKLRIRDEVVTDRLDKFSERWVAKFGKGKQ